MSSLASAGIRQAGSAHMEVSHLLYIKSFLNFPRLKRDLIFRTPPPTSVRCRVLGCGQTPAIFNNGQHSLTRAEACPQDCVVSIFTHAAVALAAL